MFFCVVFFSRPDLAIMFSYSTYEKVDVFASNYDNLVFLILLFP
jgi:hypothetical protein